MHRDSSCDNPRSVANILLTVGVLALGMTVCVVDCRLQRSGVPEPADNSYCLDCHLNYGFERFAEGHRTNGVGCVRCHGACIEHSADESGKVPPDRMYAMRRINDSCIACHEFKALSPSCELGGAKRVCTDCHDTHRLEERKRRWDKSTGELIFCAEEEDDGMGGGMDDGMDM